MAAFDDVEQLSVESPFDSEIPRSPIQEDGSSSLSVDHSLDELCISLTIEEEKEKEDSVPKQKRVHKIPRVPQILREKEARKKNKCYEPVAVSIGPHHYGKCELKEMESRKRPLARQYMKESGKPLEQVRDKLAEVAKVASRLRECYPKEATQEFDDKTFTKMMLLDGCFIIQFLLGYVKDLGALTAKFVRRDLLLLENQLPYQVLKELMSFRFSESKANDLIEDFMHEVRGLDDPHESGIEKIKAKPTGKKQEKESNEPIHLLDLFRTLFINECDLLEPNPTKKPIHFYYYPASKELKTMGIYFRPSKGSSFTDTKFRSVLGAGFLKLPKIALHDYTMSLLLNLVAYEASPDAPDKQVLTSYLYLMDTLIDQGQDVEVLRRNRIIYNMLGTDQQAADLFNEVGDDLVLNGSGVFPHVMEGLDSHYKNKCKTSTNEWLRRHFGSPWAFIGFLAASFFTILTLIQTYVTSLTYCMSQDHPYFWCPFNNNTRP